MAASVLIRSLSALAFLAVASGFPAEAQAQPRDDRFFMRDPFGARTPFPASPRRPLRTRPSAPAPAPQRVGGTIYGSMSAADRHRETQATEYVVVMGDSLATQVGQGLADAFYEERPEVAIITKTRGSSGLVRDDFYDWPAAVPELLEEENPTAIVVMLGTNDRQVLRDESGAHEVRSDRWRELYAQRIDAMLNQVKAKGVQVFVVGLPAMRLSRLSSDLEYINEIWRERAQEHRAVYVDIWDGFVDEQGEYMEFGPALDGQRRRLRMGDGVHFSRAGARKAAHYVERDLVRLFDQLGPRLPILPPGEPEVAPSGRPIAGPVLPLTQPAGPVGALAGGEERPPVNEDLVAVRVLVEGLPAEPVSGRADDFRWPRTQVRIEPPAEPQPGEDSEPQLGEESGPQLDREGSGGATLPEPAEAPPADEGERRTEQTLPTVIYPAAGTQRIITVPEENRGR